ncbi:hypothetical protein NLM59_04590 [Weeksellaceae bacterium KMM 9724]|uniref:hypothetical protein n=1 Tax=Profundicola chukchiensis TaxID=2961959 RepID=UPI00243F5DF2|nr:hypothetical protein [Profundicola chukchiensis]MDG4950192.1 hypothetical protein [Profundicola chukchiensis]
MSSQFKVPHHAYLLLEHQHQGYVLQHYYSRVSHHSVTAAFEAFEVLLEKWLKGGITPKKITEALTHISTYFIIQRWSSLDFKNQEDFLFIRENYWGETRLFMVVTNNTSIQNFGKMKYRHDYSEFRRYSMESDDDELVVRAFLN